LRAAALCQQPTFYLNFLDQRLCDALQSFNHVPGDRRLTAYSVEKLWFASGAKIHEEFDSILRS